MQPLVEYITGRIDSVERETLHRLVVRYEWFTTARRARALILGMNDAALTLPLGFRATVPPAPRKAAFVPQNDTAPPPGLPPPDENIIIDRFIARGGYRIVPAGEGDIEEVDVNIDIDPELVTEELAEIYRSQGLHAEADKIYRELNLRNS